MDALKGRIVYSFYNSKSKISVETVIFLLVWVKKFIVATVMNERR